jgi:hypothetical protein
VLEEGIMHELRLHQELLLLALSDDEGHVAFSGQLSLGLGGALFTELLLAERIAIVHEGRGGRKTYVDVRSTAAFGEPVLDAALAKLASASRRASPSTAVTRLGNTPRLRHAVAQELCHMGVLQESEQQILVLFRRRVYPTVNAVPEQSLIARIRRVLDAGHQPDDRTAALIGIAHLAGALAAIYTRKERRALAPRIKQLVDSSAGSHAAADAITAAHVAIMAATTAAVVAAS